MRYVEARSEEENRETTYRIFVTKSLQLIPQHKCLSKDYVDFLKPQVVDTRNSAEIVSDIMARAGLHF